MTRLTIYGLDESRSPLELEYSADGVHAGFPSPAQDCTETIDLNKELISHPATTFYARAVGDSMVDKGISDGDLLIVDKSLTPQEGNVVVAYLDGEFTLKTLHYDDRGSGAWLVPENASYPAIRVTADNDCVIWGVVTYNIKSQLRRR